jgi:hypothetical protein
MVRSFAFSVVVLLALSSCSGGGDSSTTAEGGTTVAGDSPDLVRVAPADAECTALWPEEVIQAAAGEGFVYFDSTADGTACTYAIGNQSVVVFFRNGTQDDFDAGKNAVESSSEVDEVDLCDAAYAVTIAPTFGYIEAVDGASNRLYNVSINGLDDPTAVATELIAAVC